MTGLTIMDLARLANVSMKTISRVINGQVGVGAKKRAEIEKMIADLGFSPNPAARAMAGSRSYLIGLLIQEQMVHYYPHTIEMGAARTCRQQGYYLTVEETKDYPLGGGAAFKARLKAARFDGLILVPPVTEDPALMTLIEDAGIPYVRISPVTDLSRAPYVYMDDDAAAYDMTRHLIDKGHTDIAFIDNADFMGSSDQRRAGYERAMQKAKLIIRPEWNGYRLPYYSSRFEEAERLLLLAHRPTAIFGAADFLALSAIAAANKLGLRVPEDVSIVGFDDAPGGESAWPPLTTIHQPIAEIAEAAARILLAQVTKTTSNTVPTSQKLDYSLVERASVKTLRMG